MLLQALSAISTVPQAASTVRRHKAVAKLAFRVRVIVQSPKIMWPAGGGATTFPLRRTVAGGWKITGSHVIAFDSDFISPTVARIGTLTHIE
jgi:hypothetical protein